jgi:hypothetical protein
MRKLDLIGLRVERLVIIKFVGTNENGHTLWKAKCDCGKFKIVLGKDFKRGKDGKQCNDCHIEYKRKKATQHGDYNTLFYNSWVNMKKRCDQEKDFIKYINYKGRGIKYNLEWFYYINFKKDMYFKYLWAKRYYGMDRLTLERRNNNSNYCFENCIFIPMKEQHKNKRNIRKFKAFSPEGKIYISKNVTKFGKRFNLSQGHISACLRKEERQHKGWTFEYIKPTL